MICFLLARISEKNHTEIAWRHSSLGSFFDTQWQLQLFSFVCWSVKMKKIYSFPTLRGRTFPSFLFFTLLVISPLLRGRGKSVLISRELSAISVRPLLSTSKKKGTAIDIAFPGPAMDFPFLEYNPRFLPPTNPSYRVFHTHNARPYIAIWDGRIAASSVCLCPGN